MGPKLVVGLDFCLLSNSSGMFLDLKVLKVLRVFFFFIFTFNGVFSFLAIFSYFCIGWGDLLTSKKFFIMSFTLLGGGGAGGDLSLILLSISILLVLMGLLIFSLSGDL